MPGQVTGTIGDQEVRLENAATESTLALLVQGLDNLAAGKGKSGKLMELYNKAVKEGAAAQEENNDAVEDNTEELEKNKQKLREFRNRIEEVGETMADGFKKIFSDATPGISGFANAFSGIPVIGTMFATLGNIVDDNVQNFRKLAGVGVDFGYGIFSMQNAAARANLPLETFSKVIQNNSESLALLTGSASDGARRFTEVSMRMNRTGAAERLAKLGYSMEEIAETTAGYMEIQTRLGRAQQMTDAQLQEGAEAYALELDKISRATGIQRSQLEESNRAMMRDVRMRNSMMMVDETERLAISGMIDQMKKVAPEQAAGLQDLIASGGVATTKAARDLALASPELVEFAKNVANGSARATDLAGAVQTTAGRANQLDEAQRRLIGVTMTAGQTNQLTALAAFQGMENFSKGSAKVTKEQEAALADQAKSIAGFDQALTAVQGQLKIILLPILEAFGRFLGNVVLPAFKGLTDFLTGLFGGTDWTVRAGAALAVGISFIFAKAAASRLIEKGFESVMGKVGLGKTPIATTAAQTAAGAGPGAGASIAGVGRGMGMAMQGMALGLRALANPMALVGLGAVTLAVMGLAKAFEIASPGFESFGRMVKEILGGLGGVVESIGKGIASVVEGIGNAIANAQTASADASIRTMEATTVQIERLNSIPGENMFVTARGITAMKDAIDGFSPGIIKGFSQFAGSLLGGDQTAGIMKVAELAPKLEIAAASFEKFKTATGGFDFAGLQFTPEQINSMQLGTTQVKNLSARLEDLNVKMKEITAPSLVEAVTGVIKDLGATITAKLGGDKAKGSSESLLSDLNGKVDILNTSMATLVGIQQDALPATKKTAKNTRHNSGSMV